VLLAILVIAAAALMLIGSRLAVWVAQLVGLGDVFTTVWTWARIPVGVMLLILIAALIYYLFPNTRTPKEARSASSSVVAEQDPSAILW
jgi:membrane protein